MVLELGCGTGKKQGRIGIDKIDLPNVNVVADLEDGLRFLPDNSVDEIHCRSVLEHINNFELLLTEIVRVLRPGGNLYFSLPVGKTRLCLNAHRIHSPRRILHYFSDLKLVEFSGTTDDKQFLRNTDMAPFETMRYACGMFWFTKERA